ncbi:hypothetical protein NE857_02240 [Nocardiopsis exhalans]|uniref:Uncharacterized protein n=1 Tax=Nocardiopsis exhalans TaxID=163604 RepID=A0ABY5DAV1_9ACTN|nr:hypothetical protein [Nocardiopsis exhalans]USY20500.1 hypothetical protein NE857_02240 [Nocardiopsis exhalans]
MSIDAVKAAETKLQKAESDHGKYEKDGNNHTNVAKAKKEYDRLNSEMSITSELLGEKSADLGARFAFDGGTLRDSKGNPVTREVVDLDGNKTLVEIEKPDLTDAVLLNPSPLAPANGNNQFDLIYRTKDGIVIVEAKGSKHTDLGETTHYPQSGKPVKVMQGRKEYVMEIANRMWQRGEISLATEIINGVNNKSLRYALFKGNPDVARGVDGNPVIESERSTPIADGFFYRMFDIYGWKT